MGKELRYMVFDSETATMPFANEIAGGDAERKKRIAIARPLIYDFGYVIVNRKGETIKRVSHLIAETFSVPSVFNTAYYADKRPKYLELLRSGETDIVTWDSAISEFIDDLNSVDFVGAYNAAFDFFKAIPFTEKYIEHIYSDDYYKWEDIQRTICKGIADNRKFDGKPNEMYLDNTHFTFRGNTYNLFDLWGLSCKYLLNNITYKNLCLDLGMITNSGEYFKSSAESSYRYLCKKHEFEEVHMAVDDATIEAFILHKIVSRRAIECGIEFFPFRNLGTTTDFILSRPKVNRAHVDLLGNAMTNYATTAPDGTYKSHIEHSILALAELKETLDAMLSPVV